MSSNWTNGKFEIIDENFGILYFRKLPLDGSMNCISSSIFNVNASWVKICNDSVMTSDEEKANVSTCTGKANLSQAHVVKIAERPSILYSLFISSI